MSGRRRAAPAPPVAEPSRRQPTATPAGAAQAPGLLTPALSERATELAPRLIAWQKVHGRHALPWQRTREPYHVWLSEIMLQQTQVSTVLGYYERFLTRFPTVAALAAAHEDEVLALWSGLGYYSRARNLHRCAQAVVAQHGGRFPGSAQALAELPGIGRSTAAAIAAFCYGEHIAILDGNVKRVLTRVLGIGADLAEARHERALWDVAQAVLPSTNAMQESGHATAQGEMQAYTQGLMDLGATLCTPRRPTCDICPWATLCVARAEGRPEAYPVKTRKLKRGARSHALLWVMHTRCAEPRVWLVQRPAQGVWAGLWTMPEFEGETAVDTLTASWPGEGRWMAPFKHVLTHLDWTLQPCVWHLPADLPAPDLARVEQDLGGGRWWPLADALAAGLPAPIRKLLEAGPPR